MLKTFETGKEYSCRSICDHNCIWTYEILKRTAKTITINIDGKNVSRRIYIYDNAECVNPLGTFSMAPILTAEKGDK